MNTQESVLQGNSGAAIDNRATPDAGSHPSVTQRVASSAHQTIDSAAVKAEELERHLRSGAAKAGDRLEHSQDAATAQAKKSLAAVESFVQERPVATVGIAFALGVLAAALLRR